MTEENIIRQNEEIDALTAIFDEGFKWVDEGCCSISVKDAKVEFTITLHLNGNYPGQGPPTYSIETEGLTSTKRRELDSKLGNIYCENPGETIIFQWISATKDFIYSVQRCEDDNHGDSTRDDHEVKEDNGDEVEDLTALVGTAMGFDYQESSNKSDRSSTKDKSGLELPPIYHGEFLRDRKSLFQGHLAPVFTKQQVDMVLESLKENKKIAEATHNIIAYRIEIGNGGFNSGCVDDGEFGASARMLNLLNIVDSRNVMVVVTRWYGGIHLGPDRFKHINNITRDLLDEYGYIKPKANAKKNQKPSSNNNSKVNKQRKKR